MTGNPGSMRVFSLLFADYLLKAMYYHVVFDSWSDRKQRFPNGVAIPAHPGS